MMKFIVLRCAQMVLVFMLFLTLLFVLLNAQPGGITQQYVSRPDIPVEARALLAERLGLDRPLLQRYAASMRNFFTGNLGVSFSQYPRPVIDILTERLPRTVFLFVTAALLAYGIGFRAGKVLAWRRGEATEHAVNVVGIGLHTVFQPWFFLSMIYVFSFRFGWFPAGKFVDDAVWQGVPLSANEVFLRMLFTAVVASLVLAALLAAARKAGHARTRTTLRWGGAGLVVTASLGSWLASPMRTYAADIIWHAVLPVTTLTLVIFGGVMLLTRSSMLETLREDYIFTARAKGLPEHVIRDRHAARNALLPVVTSLVLAVAFVIGGGIVAETIFSWPGMGEVLVNATIAGDTPLAIGALGFLSGLALVAHLVVDVLYLYLDPRLRS
jgi:peptide/nickel transport system permease protein